jgi:CheY-like chemotaxis protein
MSTRILIIDDDPVALFLHKMVVIKSGWDQSPLLFQGATGVLQHLITDKQHAPRRVMLLDLNMPDVSGWDLLAELSTINVDDVRVIIVSSSVNKRDVDKAKSYPHVVAYVEKPLTVDKLKALQLTTPIGLFLE